MFEAIGNAMKSVFVWFINFIIELITPVIEKIFDNFPNLVSDGTAPAWTGYINYVLPLDFIFATFMAFLAWFFTYVLVKIIIKLIPTVG